MTKFSFVVEIEADNDDDATEAYEALIAAAINISNVSMTAHVIIMAPSDYLEG